MINHQTQIVKELREQAVITATEASRAKAEAAREKERADDWEANCLMARGRSNPIRL